MYRDDEAKGGGGTGNLTDTAIQTLTPRRFKIPSLKIDDEQHMTRVLSRKGSYLVLQRLLLVLHKVPLKFGRLRVINLESLNFLFRLFFRLGKSGWCCATNGSSFLRLEGLFSCRIILLVLREVLSHNYSVRVVSFYRAIFDIFDIFVKVGLRRIIVLRSLSASPSMKKNLVGDASRRSYT